MLFTDRLHNNRNIHVGNMVKNKNILLIPVMWHFKNIPVTDTPKWHHTIGPHLANLINNIATPDLSKKRGDDNKGEQQQHYEYKKRKTVY